MVSWNKEILLRIDNTTAICYVNRARGIQFPHLSLLEKFGNGARIENCGFVQLILLPRRMFRHNSKRPLKIQILTQNENCLIDFSIRSLRTLEGSPQICLLQERTKNVKFFTPDFQIPILQQQIAFTISCVTNKLKFFFYK